jgi:hypothetical protein
MCLHKLDNFKVKKYEGWQLFLEEDGKLVPAYCAQEYREACGRATIPVNEWEQDKNKYMLHIYDASGEYPTGFHIFLRKKDAEMLCDMPFTYVPPGSKAAIRKVKFRKVVAKGIFFSRKVIVAKERYITTQSHEQKPKKTERG